MTTREHLHELIDALPEQELPVVERLLQAVRAGEDPVLRALLEAPEDDEPPTEQELAAVRRARQDIAAGRVVPHDALRRRLLGRP